MFREQTSLIFQNKSPDTPKAVDLLQEGKPNPRSRRGNVHHTQCPSLWAPLGPLDSTEWKPLCSRVECPQLQGSWEGPGGEPGSRKGAAIPFSQPR